VRHAGQVGSDPAGFDYSVVRGEVRITRNARVVTTLRGQAAQQFLAAIEDQEPQELMARVTGNYKRGNERTAKNHPRNR
jgi:hypothetical protein